MSYCNLPNTLSCHRWCPVRPLLIFVAIAVPCFMNVGGAHGQSVARLWDEALLDAIRIDFPAPTIHSRNLFHASAAMWDAWAAYDSREEGVFVKENHAGPDIAAARRAAISYAAYRVLSQRYTHAVDPAASQRIFDDLMDSLGYDTNVTTTVGNTPAAIGNRIAQTILDSHRGVNDDGANEDNGYVDNTGYVPVNDPMIVDYPGVVGPDNPLLGMFPEFENPNHWQPLYINSATTQNGLPLPSSLQTYVGPHWGRVKTFALGRDGTTGPYSWSGIDPGPPPQFGSQQYTDETLALIQYSHSLDPGQGPGAELINISPAENGNRPLGTHDNHGYVVNPATGAPYEDNWVKAADYGRVLAEFWADGPKSETPPGHWNVIANEVSDSPLLKKKIGGTGPVVDDLEWDVKLYVALNGAVHDASVAAWGTKRQYDYVRPITKIRYQGGLGQSSDMELPNYHPDGLPLVPDMIEQITAESIADGGRHRNAYINANRDSAGRFQEYYTEAEMVGKVVIMAWNHEPPDPENDVSGTKWILAENWVPYQMDNFVTPAFAAYVSGHSTFSRASAEVLSLFTGSEYFPGGLGEMEFTPDFLEFEHGPSSTVTLQWATYVDAADEAGISRLWGGIHVPVDDFRGRQMGSAIGTDALHYAMHHFHTVPEPTCLALLLGVAAAMSARRLLQWPCAAR